MKTTIRERTERLYDTQHKLETLVDRGVSLSSERDIEKLLHLFFQAVIELTRAQSGALYRMEDKQSRLHLVLVGKKGKPVSVSDDAVSLDARSVKRKGVALTENEKRHNILLQTIETNTPLLIDTKGISEQDWFPQALREDCEGTVLMVVPMTTSQDNNKGVLLLISRQKAESSQEEQFGHREVEFAKALAAQAAAAVDNKDLFTSLQELMDAILKVMAGAIDAKSPHTGKHCARVPVVAGLPAKAAHTSGKGPLADFEFQSEEELRAFEIAAWLHDCGKLTTPERVVSKAAKLEMVTNRIHEIRTRFEVLRRDCENSLRKRRITGEVSESEFAAALESRHKALLDAFNFVADCNVNNAVLNQEQVDRLKEIASWEYVGNFDKKRGLSAEELDRMTDDALVPATEKLLSDNPEHLIERSHEERDRLHSYHFSLNVPKYRFNHGELHNLSIKKGTLTEEERFIIQEHIIQTIFMLDHLPFPSWLSQIPEFACNHHERMDGRGYPRGIKGHELSLPARMMAVADVFEALTSYDRPYKRIKPLSEVLTIMQQMCNEGHLDADIFNLMLESNACLEYAQAYMLPEQNDVSAPLQWRVEQLSA